MNKFGGLLLVFAALISNASVSAVQCFQGQRLSQNGVVVSNNMESIECGTSLVCNRIDALASFSGQSGKDLSNLRTVLKFRINFNM